MTLMQSSSIDTRLSGALLADSLAVSSAQQASYVNPAQTTCQNLQFDQSSAQSTPSIKRKASATPKRKRNGAEERATSPPRKNRDGPKKKKANRACYHCQKAHLTCDDSRPCQRCIKRGNAFNCTEGHRKKAKYLLDEDELEKLKRSKSSTASNSSEPPQVQPTPDPFTTTDPAFTLPFDANYVFGSEHANLEYSILSAILANTSPPASGTTTPSHPSYNSGWPSDFAANGFPSAFDSLTLQPSEGLSPNFINNYPSPTAFNTRPGQPSSLQYTEQLDPNHPAAVQLNTMPESSNSLLAPSSKDVLMMNAMVTPPASASSPRSTASLPLGVIDPLRPASPSSQLQNINDRVTAPYDYTEGYHFLMKHLTSRFEKNDMLRVVRALAIFRPSFIALQMPLSFEDEVFVERCFQRSLVELEKLINMSGTPTVVWRRTGEICLVGPEFCHLTGWSKEDLTTRKTYIYELFENQSVVEYWETFASHAFENTTQSVYTHCVLLKPDGTPIPSTCSFSIRRDLFDLPSIVIGQWLPLL